MSGNVDENNMHVMTVAAGASLVRASLKSHSFPHRLCQAYDLMDSRANTPGQIPTGQIPTGQLPPLPNTHRTNTPWTYTHHKMKCEEKP